MLSLLPLALVIAALYGGSGQSRAPLHWKLLRDRPRRGSRWGPRSPEATRSRSVMRARPCATKEETGTADQELGDEPSLSKAALRSALNVGGQDEAAGLPPLGLPSG